MSSTTRTPSASRIARTTMLGGLVALGVALLVPAGAAQQQVTDLIGPDGCTSYHYLIDGLNVTILPENLAAGTVVTVVFTTADCAAGTFSLVAYNTTSFASLNPLKVFSSGTVLVDTGNITGNVYELRVTVAVCYQIVFAAGDVIDNLGSGATYISQGIFIDGVIGGDCGLAPPAGSCSIFVPVDLPLGAVSVRLDADLAFAANLTSSQGFANIAQVSNVHIEAQGLAPTTGGYLLTFDVDPILVTITLDYFDGSPIQGELASVHLALAPNCQGSATTTSTTSTPVFPSGAALALGVGGALAGAFVVLNRRK